MRFELMAYGLRKRRWTDQVIAVTRDAFYSGATQIFLGPLG